MKDNMRGNSILWDDLDQANNRVQELEELSEKLQAALNQEWILVSQPPDQAEPSCKYLVTLKRPNGSSAVTMAEYWKFLHEWSTGYGSENITRYVIAYKPMPLPYFERK